MSYQLMTKKVKINPPFIASTFFTSQVTTIKRTSGSKIVNWTEPFAVVWDDEMMNTYCTQMLQRLSPVRLVFGSVKVMGRVSVHIWQFAASLPTVNGRRASHILAEQLRVMRVPYYLVHPNGQASHCCAKEKELAPPKPPPTA